MALRTAGPCPEACFPLRSVSADDTAEAATGPDVGLSDGEGRAGRLKCEANGSFSKYRPPSGLTHTTGMRSQDALLPPAPPPTSSRTPNRSRAGARIPLLRPARVHNLVPRCATKSASEQRGRRPECTASSLRFNKSVRLQGWSGVAQSSERSSSWFLPGPALEECPRACSSSCRSAVR